MFPHAVFCSRRCYRAWHKGSDPGEIAYRERRPQLPVATRRRILERDAWMCGICGQPIDPSLAPSDPEAQSVDHIIPSSRGGSDDDENLHAAHRSCNWMKGADDLPGGGGYRTNRLRTTALVRESPRGVGEGDFLEQAWCEVAGGGRVHPRPAGTPCAICAAQEAETGRHERIRALTEGSR
jgi:5-methylcytosine-specific restriction endonuclease McrA